MLFLRMGPKYQASTDAKHSFVRIVFFRMYVQEETPLHSIEIQCLQLYQRIGDVQVTEFYHV